MTHDTKCMRYKVMYSNITVRTEMYVGGNRVETGFRLVTSTKQNPT